MSLKTFILPASLGLIVIIGFIIIKRNTCLKQNVSLEQGLEAQRIYKLVPPQDYNPAISDNCVTLTKTDRETGFIHLSFGKQVAKILEKFFKEQDIMVALELDVKALTYQVNEVKVEQNKPGGDFYPHLYGDQQIPTRAVKKVIKLIKKDGTWMVEK